MSLVRFDHVTKNYKHFSAVRDLSFTIEKNEIVGIVGESGCGKTTTAKLLLGMTYPSHGTIFWEEQEVRHLHSTERKKFRKNVQMVFQDTAASLNPRCRVWESIAEPIQNFEHLSKTEVKQRVADLMEQVGLQPERMELYPNSFSGGQRQRIAIARALALNPKLLILDEATSNLDVSIQAQILNLLLDLKEKHTLSYLVISHDLGVIHYLCDRVLVLKEGSLVEEFPGNAIEQAVDPYTRQLLEAVPDIQKRVKQS